MITLAITFLIVAFCSFMLGLNNGNIVGIIVGIALIIPSIFFIIKARINIKKEKVKKEERLNKKILEEKKQLEIKQKEREINSLKKDLELQQLKSEINKLKTTNCPYCGGILKNGTCQNCGAKNTSQ